MGQPTIIGLYEDNEVITTEKGMQTGGIYSHMRDLRTLFNEARKIYNNEDIGVVKIKHYPFKVYKIGAPPKTKKEYPCRTGFENKKMRGKS